MHVIYVLFWCEEIDIFRETGISQKFKGRRDSNTHYEIHNGLGTSYYDLNEAEFSWAVF